MEGAESQFVVAGDQQIVLSASDAAQLLAQAGIQLGDNDQVIIGGMEDGQIQLGVSQGTEERTIVPAEEIPQEVVSEAGQQGGEILYIDPNDPQAAALLQQAGLTLAPDGSVQAIDGSVVEEEAGISTEEDTKPVVLPVEMEEESSFVQGTEIPEVVSTERTIKKEAIIPNIVKTTPEPRKVISSTPKQTTPKPMYQQIVQKKKLQFAQERSQTEPAQQQQQIVQVGPDQQQVMYTVTSEDGRTQQYMMLCPKDMDQQTLIQTLVKQITSDPNNKGKKTIRITKQKTPKSGSFKNKSVSNKGHLKKTTTSYHSPVTSTPKVPLQQSVQRRIVSERPQEISRTSSDILDSALMAMEETKEVLETSSVTPQLPTTDGSGLLTVEEPAPPTDPSNTRVFVRCNYCPDFKTVLNSETWESILNHILPVAKEEIFSTFYGDLSKHFVRSLRIQVNGRQIVKTGGLMIPQCEVVLTHSLVCMKTKREFLLDKPTPNFVADLAKHIRTTGFGNNRGNSLLCVFCNSPYTYEDYIRHVTPHQDVILATLNCFAGAYCASSYESMMKVRDAVCSVCQEIESSDIRFQPCTKFSPEYTCVKKLQFAIDCFRENYGDNGFMRLNTSSVTRCSVCKNSQNVYCVVFHISTTVLSEDTQEVHDVDSQLSVCINCQKQFINIVMKEQAFEKKLKLFQLKNMEQLCSCLRVILNQAAAVCERKNALIYTVQETVANPTASIHSVKAADVAEVMPITKLVALSETGVSTSRIKAVYQCELCGFFIDLTSLVSSPDQTQKNDMLLAVVLEHLVPHTESLIAVIAASSSLQTFNLKFDVLGRVTESGGIRKIHLSLQRKVKSSTSNVEVGLDKNEEKTFSQIRATVKAERKNVINIKSASTTTSTGTPPSKSPLITRTEPSGGSAHQLAEVNKFIDKQRGKLGLLAQSGCNTALLNLYAECKLCSKFSYPDFRLSGIGTSTSIELCENCVDTVLTLCLPTDPEVLSIPEECFVLGEEKPMGHRLVLSNNLKKWLSLDGVNLIKKTVDEYEEFRLFDTSALLSGALRKHLIAAIKKCWLDSTVVTVAAGFAVTSAFLSNLDGKLNGGPITGEEVRVKVLAKKPVIQPAPARERNGSGPIQRKVIVSNGSLGSKLEEEETVSAIQSFLESTEPKDDLSDGGDEDLIDDDDEGGEDYANSLLEDVKVPAGIKITAAGKGVVNIRAIADARANKTVVTTPKVIKKEPVKAKKPKPVWSNEDDEFDPEDEEDDDEENNSRAKKRPRSPTIESILPDSGNESSPLSSDKNSSRSKRIRKEKKIFDL